MKKDYGRLGLPNLLKVPTTKTAAPIVDKVQPIVNKEESKIKKKTKEEQPQDEVLEAPAE